MLHCVPAQVASTGGGCPRHPRLETRTTTSRPRSGQRSLAPRSNLWSRASFLPRTRIRPAS
eukprot:11451463-Heterocapsa_arctica.AAC.1